MILKKNTLILDLEWTIKIGIINSGILSHILENIKENGITKAEVSKEIEINFNLKKSAVSKSISELEKYELIVINDNTIYVDYEKISELENLSKETFPVLPVAKPLKKEDFLNKMKDIFMETVPEIFRTEEIEELFVNFLKNKTNKKENVIMQNIKRLLNFSENNPEFMKAILEKSVAGSYQTFFELKEWEKNRILNSQKQTSYKNRLSEMPGNKEESMKLINVFEKYEKEAGDYFE